MAHVNLRSAWNAAFVASPWATATLSRPWHEDSAGLRNGFFSQCDEKFHCPKNGETLPVFDQLIFSSLHAMAIPPPPEVRYILIGINSLRPHSVSGKPVVPGMVPRLPSYRYRGNDVRRQQLLIVETTIACAAAVRGRISIRHRRVRTCFRSA